MWGDIGRYCKVRLLPVPQVGLFSAFLNNTPIVAMLLPACPRLPAPPDISRYLPYLLTSPHTSLGQMRCHQDLPAT